MTIRNKNKIRIILRKTGITIYSAVLTRNNRGDFLPI
jgi:hypothetical protein